MHEKKKNYCEIFEKIYQGQTKAHKQLKFTKQAKLIN